MAGSKTLEEIKAVWKKADAVCFDVDSTVMQDEALDELAKFCGVGKEVQEWTNKAMGGGVTFRVALTERLNIVQPSHQNLKEFISSHKLCFTPGIKELVSALQQRNVSVFLVSGGFQSIIEPAAKQLNIPKQNIYANRLKFYYNGQYAGFDENQPTSSSGGKTEVAKLLKEKHGFQNLIFIGDGITDMEACPPADAFIGFGGNVERSSVRENSAWFVKHFKELLTELDVDS
ncbi:hypothetical protein FSP39_018884 [Pinctada imbricata]|uniref:Phosphoserine phosphatase n=1 Tax=Pinctada imbricata TaxID=66713 RepID=A0AA88YEF1_PINIB|nr:hypothetical protein FSP39_018884 [Pinctada imbricata]